MSKKIITTVGTSLVENLRLSRIPSSLRDRFSNVGNVKDTLEDFKNSVDDKLSSIKDSDFTICAELQSIAKIRESNVEIEVYLICTDTILSPLCAEFIAKRLISNGISVKFKYNNHHIIEGLIVDGANASTTFEEQGFPNLIQIIKEIEKQASSENRPILNISGGYKALIPVMTIMGQLYNMEVNYMYESSSDIIKLGRLPINFDFDLGEALAYLFDNNLSLDDKLKKFLLSYSLIKINNHRIEPTIITRLFIEYVKERSIFSQSNLGFFLEYLLFYYYSSGNDSWYHQPSKIDLNLFYIKGSSFQFTEDQTAGSIKVGDIDLLLRLKNSKSISLVEIKSRTQLEHINSDRDYYEEQVKARIEGYYYRKKKYPDCYTFIVYQTLLSKSSVSFEKVKKICLSMQQKLSKDYPDMKMELLSLTVELKANRQGISYTELLQKGIQSSVIQKLI